MEAQQSTEAIERLENVYELTLCGIFEELKSSATPRCEPQTSQRQKCLVRLLSAIAENFIQGTVNEFSLSHG
jgi:hypothetical protein